MSWAQALVSDVPFAYSDLFTVPYPLGGTQVPANPPPYLQGLQSFNVSYVPEPSVIWLGFFSTGLLSLLTARLRGRAAASGKDHATFQSPAA